MFEYDKWMDCISAPKNGILLAAARRRGDGMKAFAGSKAQFLMSLTIKNEETLCSIRSYTDGFR